MAETPFDEAGGGGISQDVIVNNIPIYEDKPVLISDDISDIPEDITENDFNNPSFTHIDWENYNCEKLPHDIQYLKDNNILTKDFEGGSGNSISLVGNNGYRYLALIPVKKESKINLNVSVKLSNPKDSDNSPKWFQGFSITLETSDIFAVDIDNSYFQLSLIKNGVQHFNNSEMSELSSMYQNFEIDIEITEYVECTRVESEPPIDDDETSDDTSDDTSDGLSIYVILGGLIAFLVLSFLLSTTGESNDG